MKVGKLIELLKEVDPEVELVIKDSNVGTTSDIALFYDANTRDLAFMHQGFYFAIYMKGYRFQDAVNALLNSSTIDEDQMRRLQAQIFVDGKPKLNKRRNW